MSRKNTRKCWSNLYSFNYNCGWQVAMSAIVYSSSCRYLPCFKLTKYLISSTNWSVAKAETCQQILIFHVLSLKKILFPCSQNIFSHFPDFPGAILTNQVLRNNGVRKTQQWHVIRQQPPHIVTCTPVITEVLKFDWSIRHLHYISANYTKANAETNINSNIKNNKNENISRWPHIFTWQLYDTR